MNMAFSDSRAFDASDVVRGLRPLAWSELCARLVAAQDLRRHQAGPNASGGAGDRLPPGSFHGGAAQMLEQRYDLPISVNPTSSSNRKDEAGTYVDSRETPLIERTTRQADENCHD